MAPDLPLIWHWLTTLGDSRSWLNAFFTTLRRKPRPSDGEALAAIARRLAVSGCFTVARQVIEAAPENGWALVYALAWLSVVGGNSVMPPWVRHLSGWVILNIDGEISPGFSCGPVFDAESYPLLGMLVAHARRRGQDLPNPSVQRHAGNESGGHPVDLGLLPGRVHRRR